MSKKKKRKIYEETAYQTVVPEKVAEPIYFMQIVKNNWKFLLFLGLVVIGINVNMLRGDFVSDDYATILNNPAVTNIWENLKVANLSSFLNSIVANLFGNQSPVPYHAMSLVLYLAVLFFAFVWLSIWFDQEVVKVAMILYSFLPIHVENVAWNSGKPYVLIALFTMISLTMFSLYVKTGLRKYLVLFILALPVPFWVERARGFTVLLSVILFAVFFHKKFVIKIDWKKFLLAGSLLALLMVYFVWPMARSRMMAVNSGYNSSDSVFYNPFFQYPTAVAKYLQLMFFPADLTLYHTMFVFPIWLNWTIFLLYFGLLVYFWFKNKNILFALMFIFVPTLPSMAPLKVGWLVAERYMFTGSLGFVLFLVLISEGFWRRYKSVSLGALIVLIAIMGVRIYQRNVDWQTNHNLWVNTCQVSPNSHNAWNNIGDDYDKLRQWDNSIKGFTQSTVVKPNYADAFHNRANIFFKMGRLDLARDSYETAMKFSPGLFQSYMSLIQIDLNESRFDLAEQHTKQALQIEPNNPQGYYALAVIYSNFTNKQEEAKKILQQILQVYPDYALASELYKRLNGV